MNDLTVPKNMELVDVLHDADLLARIESVANLMAKGRTTVPRHLQGSPADCMAVIMQAAQWGMNPFAVAQKTHLIHGVLGYEAQLVNAVVQRFLQDVPHYTWDGDWSKVLGKTREMQGEKGKYHVPDWKPADEEGLSCTISILIKGNNEPKTLTVQLKQATVRNSTLWAADPRQQLAYLALKKIARLYLPGAILGVYTPDEIEPLNTVDMGSVEPERTKTVREKLAHRVEDIQKQEEGYWIANIMSVTTMAELGEMAQKITALTPAMQDALRDPFLTRKRELRDDLEKKIDPDQVMKIVNEAPDLETLKDASDMIEYMDKRKQPWKEINEAIQVRIKEMQE